MTHRYFLPGVLCAGAVALSATTASGQTTATWTGDGNNRNYSNPANWNPPIVPINNGATQYSVVIPSGVHVELDPGITSDFGVYSIELGVDSRFSMATGRTLTVEVDTNSRGRFELSNSSRLLYTAPSGAIPSAELRVISGSVVSTAATRYAVTDVALLFGSLFEANGNGSRLDLSSLNEIDYSLDGDTETISIDARFGGVIDMSSVSTLSGSEDDTLRFDSEGAGSFIDLRSVASIENGSVTFESSDGGMIDLSGLENLDGTNRVILSALGAGSSFDLRGLLTLGDGIQRTLSAYNGAAIDASSLVSLGTGEERTLHALNGGVLDVSSLNSISNAELLVTGTGKLMAGAATSAGGACLEAREGGMLSLPALHEYDTLEQFANRSNGEVTIFDASGAGSQIDVPKLSTLDFGDTSTRSHEFIVLARAGGSINLSSLDSITHHGINDDLSFHAENPDSRITLGPLSMLSMPTLELRASDGALIDASQMKSIGSGNSIISSTGDGALIDISGLQDLGSGDIVRIRAFESSRIDASSLINIGPSGFRQFEASENATIDLASLVSMENARVGIQGNGRILAGKVTNADGAEINILGNGSHFELPSLTSYDTGEELRDTTQRVFNASGTGSMLDLSQLTTLRYGRPTGSFSPTYLIRAGEGMIDLSGLSFLFPTGNQSLRFESEFEGGLIKIGDLSQFPVKSASFRAENEGVIDIRSVILDRNTAFVGTDGGSIRIQGNLSYLDGRMEFDQASRLVIGGAFLNADTDESRFEMTDAVVQLTANTSGPHTIEAASLDNGPNTDTSVNDGNFGLGTLIVGETDRKLYLHLLDAQDNGNRISNQPEAFYLFGAGGMDGLELLGGSRLFIYDIQVYASINGVLTNLQSLFPEGATEYALGDGYVVIPAPPAIALAALLIGFSSRRRPN